MLELAFYQFDPLPDHAYIMGVASTQKSCCGARRLCRTLFYAYCKHLIGTCIPKHLCVYYICVYMIIYI